MADGNITVNVNMNWEPVNPAALALVAVEMRAAREKYTEEHDDFHGVGHLVDEALVHLHHGANPYLGLTADAVRHELTVAIGLLFNAFDVVGRSGKGVVTEFSKPEPDQVF